jgi:hypothetical protein
VTDRSGALAIDLDRCSADALHNSAR